MTQSEEATDVPGNGLRPDPSDRIGRAGDTATVQSKKLVAVIGEIVVERFPTDGQAPAAAPT